MTTEARGITQDPTPEEFAEAAAWVARLHGPDRTLQTDRGFQRWLTAAPAHATAFEAMTAAWEVSGRLPMQDFPRVSRWERAGYRRGFIRAGLAVAMIAALALVAILYIDRTRGVVTEIGEQRLVTLQDGTRVFLNTETRIVVRYDDSMRKVELKRGEAQFDVAQSSQRPFVVQAGGRQIVALGTSFVVREDRHGLSVTLIEGKVSVASPGDGRKDDTNILVPGQRLTFNAIVSQPPRLDRPSIERVTAWRRGQLDFDATPLADAASEMNRYSLTKVVVEGARARDIPITGVFRAGDASSFVSAISRLYRLHVIEDKDGLHLVAAPSESPAMSGGQNSN